MKRSHKKTNVFATVVLCMASIVILSLVIPVKIPINDLPSDKQYYIAVHYWANTDVGWFINEDENGRYRNEWGEPEEYDIAIVGNDPLNTLSHELLSHGVRIILYGTMEETLLDNGYTSRVLHCTGWDVWGGSQYVSRRPLEYLTVYDLRWFDTFCL